MMALVHMLSFFCEDEAPMKFVCLTESPKKSPHTPCQDCSQFGSALLFLFRLTARLPCERQHHFRRAWPAHAWRVGEWCHLLREAFCFRPQPIPGNYMWHDIACLDVICWFLIEQSLSFSLIVLVISIFTYFPCFQEPLLVFPETFMRYLTNIPLVPRPLKQLDLDRCKKLLQLAQTLLHVNPTVSSERTAKYLVELTKQNPEVDPLPELQWISTRDPSDFDALAAFEVNRSKPVQALMPQMRFSARLGRGRWKTMHFRLFTCNLGNCEDMW